MPLLQVFPPTPPEFHPEFGYIWPAAQTRRMVRVGLMSTAVGVIFGAIAVLAMTPRADPDLAHAETILTATPAEELTADGAAISSAPVAVVATAAPVVPVETVTPPAAAAAAPQAPVTAAKSCKEQTWPYLEGKCLKDANRKRQQVRVLKPEAPAQSAPARVVPATTPEVTAAVKAEEPAKVSSKKREKTAQTRQRRRDREFAESERGRYVDPRSERGRYADPRSSYAYESRYEQPHRGWGW